MGTASHTLAEFVTALRATDIPDAVQREAVRHLVDSAGVALAAATEPPAAPLAEMARSWAGATEARVVGHDLRAPTAVAALVNGAATHALHYDDTHVESVMHPSSVIVPAALAVGEEIGATGLEVITAIVAGYEVATRVGAAAPGRFQVRGFDTTGVCGAFGAAAAAGRLWGLSHDELATALGIAGSASAGVQAAPFEGAPGLRGQPGWAAFAGIVAADLARRGASGPATIFEGPHGFFDAFLHGEQVDAERLTRALGADWETQRIAIKPYPACDFLHAFIDAAARATVRWADIEEIVCLVAPAVVEIVAEPRAPRLHPETTAAAQFSLPFAVASAIVGGREGLELFGDDARHDRRVLTLAERVHHRSDATAPFPQTYGGRMKIHTRSGRTKQIDEPINRGHPDRPLSDEELAGKFMANAVLRLGEDRARAALHALDSVREARSIEDVTMTLSTPAP